MKVTLNKISPSGIEHEIKNYYQTNQNNQNFYVADSKKIMETQFPEFNHKLKTLKLCTKIIEFSILLLIVLTVASFIINQKVELFVPVVGLVLLAINIFLYFKADSYKDFLLNITYSMNQNHKKYLIPAVNRWLNREHNLQSLTDVQIGQLLEVNECVDSNGNIVVIGNENQLFVTKK